MILGRSFTACTGVSRNSRPVGMVDTNVVQFNRPDGTSLRGASLQALKHLPKFKHPYGMITAAAYVLR